MRIAIRHFKTVSNIFQMKEYEWSYNTFQQKQQIV